ncbi:MULTISPECIES: undecaprenyl-diphosphate phosphatase [Metallosphaera]|uniref:undecaprenyl-diphosphate phosphatase n=2 Tax=Sulfolobaceae TaxID=118883 RepID=UPI001F06B2BE|nr:undecaprenyl-diphosphate phosphatase [Metallosphaera sedula]MCH1771510.1 undecaprenyl-diphosphate phosphatase [Metallosphaera sedula]MCP6728626.1 undecaprenyl-diphosphate phosphatase [Metallosphaera sedula]
MNYVLVGIVLGLVQGISEWLPISSKTQVLIASTFLLGLPFSLAYAFGLFMEIGTIFAAVIYFRREIVRLVKALVGRGTSQDVKLLKFVVVITLITGIIGVPLYLFVINLVTSAVVGIPMTVLGVILVLDGIVIYLTRKRYVPRRGLNELTWKDMVIVGIAQGLAALPGVSRSGMTTSAMILLGVKPEEAFRLSFLSLIPAALGAIGVTVIFSKAEVVQAVHLINVTGLAVSMIVATGISLVLIDALLKFARSGRVLILVFSLGVLAILSGILSSIFGG